MRIGYVFSSEKFAPRELIGLGGCMAKNAGFQGRARP